MLLEGSKMVLGGGGEEGSHRDFRSSNEVLSRQFKCMNTERQKYEVWQLVVNSFFFLMIDL